VGFLVVTVSLLVVYIPVTLAGFSGKKYNVLVCRISGTVYCIYYVKTIV
jgi:hypothetical protein